MEMTIDRIDPITTVSNYLSLLEEDQLELKLFAIKELNNLIYCHWHEISDKLITIEECYEDNSFPERKLAASLVSKIYFYLEDYNESLKYLLLCADSFDPYDTSLYTRFMVTKCIDEFIKISKERYIQTTQSGIVDNQININHESEQFFKSLEILVINFMNESTKNGKYKEAIDIVTESHRVDLLKSIFDDIIMANKEEIMDESYSKDDNIIYFKSNLIILDMVKYTINLLKNYIYTQSFITRVYNLLVEIIGKLDKTLLQKIMPLYCECYYYLDNYLELARQLINQLNNRNLLTVYSIAFDLENYATQTFISNLINEIENNSSEVSDDEMLKSFDNLKYILKGEASIDFILQFIHMNNNPDLGILEHIKSNSDQRSSVIHSSLVMAHGLIQAGTTCDVFLRNNLEWLGKSTHWARFSTSASLGVIQMGNRKNSFKVLSTCLPPNIETSDDADQSGTAHVVPNSSTNSNSVHGGIYSEAGAYYALGLVHVNNYDITIKNYFLKQLQNSQRNEVTQHGIALGLGLMSMGTKINEIYEELKSILYMDNAVAGEAAAYAIGMLMLGSADENSVHTLITYARDTQHEKIIRACTLSVGLILLGKGNEALRFLDDLYDNNEVYIRYGSIYSLGLAYCATSNHEIINKLLHFIVNELSNDNKRAGVYALGLVLCNNKSQLISTFKLFCDSYNPHIRYSAILTLGIMCSCTEDTEIINIAKSLTTDSIDFVRQAAYMALGFLLQQNNDYSCNEYDTLRRYMIKTSTDKHQSIITRTGSILGVGLMDIGGRNLHTSLFSNNNTIRNKAIVGYILFTQFWYWYPLVHTVSLMFTPSFYIGLNEKLQMPKSLKLKDTSKSGQFDYPKTFTVKSEDKKVIMTAVLSAASKKNKKNKQNEKETLDGEKNDQYEQITVEKVENNMTDEFSITGTFGETSVHSLGEDDSNTIKTEEKLERNLSNPFRVLTKQENYIEYIQGSRYLPLISYKKSGFILLKDTKPNEPEEYAFLTIDSDNKMKDKTDSSDNKNDTSIPDTKLENEDSKKDIKEGEGTESSEIKPPNSFKWDGNSLL